MLLDTFVVQVWTCCCSGSAPICKCQQRSVERSCWFFRLVSVFCGHFYGKCLSGIYVFKNHPFPVHTLQMLHSLGSPILPINCKRELALKHVCQ